MKKNHLALKIIAVVLAICIVLGSVSCALVYFDIVDIPFIAKILGKQDEDSHFTNLEGKFTDIKITDEKSAIEAVASVGEQIGIENAEKDLKVESVNKVDGDSYYRMQQYYNDIPVYGKSVTVAADKDGNASALSSNAIKDLKNLKDTPKTTVEEANIALRKYFNDDSLTVNELNAENLTYYVDDNNKPILAYKLESVIPGQIIFVNALNGEVVGNAATIYQNSAEARYKDKTFNAFVMDDGQYLMSNADKNYFVFNADGNKTIKPDEKIKGYVSIKDSADPMLSKDNIFGNNGDEFNNKEYGKAVSVMEVIDKISVFYKKINSAQDTSTFFILNDGFDEDNAFGGYEQLDTITSYSLPYDKNKIIAIYFGKDYSNDLAKSIDTLGHEFTHGVTRGLVDWKENSSIDEPGAINEAYSDIFGELIEEKINGKTDWTHGNRIIYNPDKNDYPSKDNSKEIIDVKIDDIIGIKKGIRIKNNDGKNTLTDFSHGYSTVISHAAYLMWNGINGTEDWKIDSEKLAKLWYRALLMMPSDATFAQCANAVETAAWQMYRDGEQLTTRQVACVRYAFQKVGITPENSMKYIYKESQLYVKGREMNPVSDYNLKVIEDGKRKNVVLDVDVNDANAYYDLKLDPGFYILKVTDISKNGSKKEYTKEVTVLNNKPIDNTVTIYTDFNDKIITVIEDETKKQKILEATDEDIKNLEVFLEKMLPFYYDYSTANNADLLEIFLDPVSPITYNYFFGDVEKIFSDPLNKLEYHEEAAKCPVDNLNWIAENIFNKKLDMSHMSYDDLRAAAGYNMGYAYEGNYYWSYGGLGYIGHATEIRGYEKLQDGTYNVVCDFYQIDDNVDYSYGRTPKGDFYEIKYIKAALKMIDGKKYWTFYKVSNKSFFTLSSSSVTIPPEATTVPTTVPATEASSNDNIVKAVYAGVDTPEQLRKTMQGGWAYTRGNMLAYTFYPNGRCYMLGLADAPGEWSIDENKNLHLKIYGIEDETYHWRVGDPPENNGYHDPIHYWYISNDYKMYLDGHEMRHGDVKAPK